MTALTAFENIPEELRSYPQWVCHDAAKRPINPHTGQLADVSDPTTWGSFDQARAAHDAGKGVGIGFVFTESDPFTGIDLDVPQGEGPSAFQNEIYNRFPSYTETSPSGRGLHIIVKGRVPAAIKDSAERVEVYTSGRYFTVTGNVVRGERPLDMQEGLDWLTAELRPQEPTASQSQDMPEDVSLVGDEDAVAFVRKSDKNRQNWDGEGVGDQSNAFGAVVAALALVGCSREQAKRLALSSPLVVNGPPHSSGTRSQKSARDFDRMWPDMARRGAQERQERAQGVEHGRQVAGALLDGWKAQDGEPAFNMTFVTGNERAVQMEHLIDPWLPKRNVVGLFGRGEAGKSTWASSLCAHASAQVSTLWVSSEEDTNHVALRFTHSGGEPNTLITLTANPVKYDKQTGKAVATTFDVYAHLETAIADYRKVPGYRADRPLGIVVLDAINALVAWGKGENANDDASVKRMLSHLHTLAMNYDLSIVILGHMNKGTNKEHGADAVTGSAAWTNSLRRAFMFYKDVASDDYEGFVRTAKGNTGTAFAASYKTVPVYTLLKRAGGMDEVLCRVELTSELVWGERSIAKLLNDSDDEDPTRDKRHKREERMKMYATHVATVIRQGATTRDAINAALPKEVGTIYPKYWAKVDALLGETYGIDVVTVSHGKYEYKVRNPNAAGAGIPERPYTL